MTVFAFGFSYSAEALTRLRPSLQVAGTVRQDSKVEALRQRGLTALRFDDEDAVRAAIMASEALLVSAAPERDGDPVLRRYGDAIRAGRGKPIVYLSTIGVYGDAGGAWIDETAPLVPTSDRNRARVDAEAEWAAIAAETGAPLAILRLGGIYGPGRNALGQLRDGTARRIHKVGQVFNRIHVDDIARAIGAALDQGADGVWNVADDEPTAHGDVIVFAAHLLGVTPPPEIPFETADMSAMARSFYGSNKRVRNQKLKQDLSFEFRFPTYREGLSSLWQDGEGGP